MHKVTFENTPNPATMKFLLGKQVTSQGFDCPSAEDAERSPLAAKIFGFPWTSSVFVGPDFITVTKQDWVDWELLAQPLSGLIQEHLDRDEPVVVEFVSAPEDDTNDLPIVRNIKSVLNREIRPVVALDGGDIVFYKYENNVLYIRMKGACSGCPSSQITLKDGIETRMKELFPEIEEVVAV
ncbi:MAG: nitrogen fixation protein NifU [Bdellovibrio sp. ArHS]|uniref:NifU family protein n=1 Tax=Bdellovibrio sp. ArHS TaxID=1569284 RepID=UPI00058249A6|nr:NifU family protein [Bdellovibrio sp. ArHS]KHD88147.1 MAG: nitrogen fixation protein NifU [Bdellovibrio sp. ArHS]